MWDVHYALLARGDSSRHAGTDEAAEISRVGHTSATVCASGTRSPKARRAAVRCLVYQQEGGGRLIFLSLLRSLGL